MAYVQEVYQPPALPISLSAPGTTFPVFAQGLNSYLTQLNAYNFAYLTQLAANNNNNAQGTGANIASAPTITITSSLHIITGNTTVTNIIAPAGFQGLLTLISQNGFTIANGGNISNLNPTNYLGPGAYMTLNYNPATKLWYGDSCRLQASSGSGNQLLNTTGSSAGQVLQSTGSGLPAALSSATYPISVNDGDLLYGSAKNVVSALADVAVGSFLRSGGVLTPPTWSALTLPNAATQGDILIALGVNQIGSLPDTAINEVLVSGGVGAPPSYSANPVVNSISANEVTWIQPVGTPNVLSYSNSMTPNLALGDQVKIAATNTSAFTINNPTNPALNQRWMLMLTNSSGGSLGTISWGAAFKLLDTLTAPANGKNRFFEFLWDGSVHWMMWESGYDVG